MPSIDDIFAEGRYELEFAGDLDNVTIGDEPMSSRPDVPLESIPLDGPSGVTRETCPAGDLTNRHRVRVCEPATVDVGPSSAGE